MNVLVLVLATLAPLQSSGDPAAFERGLAAIQPQRIRADLTFLADDEMRGRDTPSPEQRVAARYLRARVAQLGFEPAGEDGSFFDRYRLGFRRLDAEASSLSVREGEHERRLAFGKDYFFAVTSDGLDLDVEGGVVYLGEGGRDEFEAAGAAVQGRWVLCLDTGTRALQRKKRAQEFGAVGLLVTPGPDYSKEPYATRFARTTEGLLDGRLTSGPIPEGPDGPDGPEGPDAAPEAPRDEVDAPPLPQVYVVPALGSAWISAHEVGDEIPLVVHETRRATETVEVENVCALWRGSDPTLAQDAMIVSAHYDHVGVNGDDVYNGADDNGSGSSGLLAVAEALAAHGPLSRSVLLIWVSGEEKGLFGSQAWAAAPTLEAGMRPVSDLNIDMIGRNAPERLGITPSENHRQANFLSKVARELAPLEGFPVLESADEYYNRSDQANFAKLDIPVCFFFSGEHEDYHKPTDTADKIDYDKIHRVSRLVYRMLTRLDSQGF
jgi:hypothetical protein